MTLLSRPQPHKLPIWLVHFLMLFCTIIVSSSFTVGEAITRGLDPSVLLLVRYFIAIVFLLPIILTNHRSLPEPVQILGYLSISACTVGFFWCMFTSLRYTTALNTSVIFTLVPGISGIYSAVFLKERLGKYRVTALVLGLLGAIWVIFKGDIRLLLAMETNQGDLLFLAGCFLMAAYTPLVRKVHKKENMIFMTFWVLVCGLLFLIFLSIPKIGGVVWHEIEFNIWLGIAYLGIFSTVVSFYLTHIATIYLGPTRVMAYSYFYPAFVLAINWFLGLTPPLKIMPGVIIVTLATFVIQKGAGEALVKSK